MPKLHHLNNLILFYTAQIPRNSLLVGDNINKGENLLVRV